MVQDQIPAIETESTLRQSAHSGDPERSNRLIMNTHSGDHEHRLADA